MHQKSRVQTNWGNFCKSKKKCIFFFVFWIHIYFWSSWNLRLFWLARKSVLFRANNRLHFCPGWLAVKHSQPCKSSPSFPSFCAGLCFWRWSATTSKAARLATAPPSTSKMALGSTLLAGCKTDFSAARIHCLWRESRPTYPLTTRPPAIQSCHFCLQYPIASKAAFAEAWG